MKVLNGIDISKWQKGIDLSKIKFDFVIAKATEGVGYVDKCCDEYIQFAIQNNKLWGFYHFARPMNDAVKEAEFFVKNTKNYFGSGIPCLDWEAENKWDIGWAKRWLDKVFQMTGVRPIVYTSEYYANAYDWSPVVNAGYQLWCAKYKDRVADVNYNMSNAGNPPQLKHWEELLMWQWTSTGRLDGYKGNLDCDVFYGDSSKWNEMVKVVDNNNVTVAPTPSEIETKPTKEQIVEYICNGTNGWKGVYGEERFTKLRALGYDPNEIQRLVNLAMSNKIFKPVYHIVTVKQTLSGIAIKYGTTVAKIMALNPEIYDKNKIRTGQKIRVK